MRNWSRLFPKRAAYMATAKSSKAQRRALKKNAGKALRTVGNVIDNMSSMIG